MLEQLDCDYMMINGSDEGRSIDVLRSKIANYSSSVSLMGGRKYVILDEADYMNPESIQPALRNFMEQFSSNCGFIMTCNFANRIIEPLHSRCSTIKFQIKNSDKPALAKQLMSRMETILETEDIEYDRRVLVEIIKKHFPDYRKVLNEIQRYSVNGKIDSGILTVMSETNINSLIKLLQEKRFVEVRKWVVNNLDNDFPTLMRAIYDASWGKMEPSSIPLMVTVMAEYQDKATRVPDQEINTLANVDGNDAGVCLEMTSPFEYSKSITTTGVNMMVDTDNDKLAEKLYEPFIVNRSMSGHMDLIFLVNEMNLHPWLPKHAQYMFYLNTIRKHKRKFAEWMKPEKIRDIELVKEYYGYSNAKAVQALKILSTAQLDQMRETLNKGG